MNKPIENKPTETDGWQVADAQHLYAMDTWGDGFFFVNEAGHVAVRPLDDQDLSIDIPRVIQAAEAEGATLPLLIRFQDVLRARVRRLNEAFREAIAESGYQNHYQGVFPIKVNQLLEVVEEVLDASLPFDGGLECGSKAELIATLPLIADQRLLLCNGVKDREMLMLIADAQQLGQHVLPVIEKYSEFEQLMQIGDQRQMALRFAVRVKLSTRGSGRWFESGGSGSKFGITIAELMRLVHELEQRGAQDRLGMLHFHLGSQIADIQVLKIAVREITQIYANLRLRGIAVSYLDVGGGLGVNYGGDYGNSDSTINYGLKEYANAVVYTVQEVCMARDVPQPVLLSESGRAITAHHSVLVVPVLGVHRPDSPAELPPLAAPPSQVSRLQESLDLAETGTAIEPLLEAFHDAQETRAEADELMRLGFLDLLSLAHADRLYWRVCREVLQRLQNLELASPPPEQELLQRQLTDLYLGNFSVFHSVIDHWAINQLFPVMPLHRLNEEPRRRGQVVDLTCDSDGKVSRYVHNASDPARLPLHPFVAGEPYYLGFFLVGAYQEILGDSHNLIGRVSEVHVYASAEEPEDFYIEKVIPGITVKEMLAQVQYFPNELNRRMSELVKRKISEGVVRPTDGMRILNQYSGKLERSTYCSAMREPEADK